MSKKDNYEDWLEDILSDPYFQKLDPDAQERAIQYHVFMKGFSEGLKKDEDEQKERCLKKK